MWKIFFLVPSKKPATRENWDKLSVYFSLFESRNLQLCQKKPFDSWQFCTIGVLVNFITRKLKSKHLACLSWSQNMCQKNLSPEKQRQAKCLFFSFWMIEFTVIPKNKPIWCNWCFGQFYHSKLKSNCLVFSGDSFFWGNERKFFTHILGFNLSWKDAKLLKQWQLNNY